MVPQPRTCRAEVTTQAHGAGQRPSASRESPGDVPCIRIARSFSPGARPRIRRDPRSVAVLELPFSRLTDRLRRAPGRRRDLCFWPGGADCSLVHSRVVSTARAFDASAVLAQINTSEMRGSDDEEEAKAAEPEDVPVCD